MSRKRRLWIAWMTLPVLLLVGDLLYWGYAVRQLDAGFQAWVEAQRSAGWTVQATLPTIGGWPTAATLTTSSVTLAGGTMAIPGGIRWSADHLVLRIALLHPHLLHASVRGGQQLRVGSGPSIPFTSDRMMADLPLQPDAPPNEVHLQAHGLRARVPAGGVAAELAIGALDASLVLHAEAGRTEPTAAFALNAAAIALPPGLHWVFGRRIAALSLDGGLHGTIPPGPDPTARLTAWRNGGGALDIRQFGLRWGTLDLSGSTALRLDPQLQPIGTGTVRMVGYAETLDTLAAGGVLPRTAVIAAKAVLSLMAQPTQPGHPAEVDVPLSVQNRTLSLQHVPLLRLPELDWPAG